MALAAAPVAVAAACLEGGVPCGDGFCAVDHACVLTREATHLCLAPGKRDLCGNGVVEGVEICDDGNTADGDGCSADCQCGDAVVDPALEEVCDDGNARDGDGCSADCRCGNGVVDRVRGETCDCGAGDVLPAEAQCRGAQNAASGGYCRDDCQVHCGDGRVAEEEACDPGALITTPCAALRYDFGRPGCTSACDGLSTASCGDWNWRLQEPGTTAPLLAVWGHGPNDVFAVGDAGAIVHYDGQRWEPMDSSSPMWLGGVWGSGPRDESRHDPAL
ncbi:hypothetical protein BE20_11990 [Sorangium cellulosum]|nr:hypothetical protein BE20_11990 [Sorangium cellulosum]